MCRMLGIVASEPTDFKVCLREAPRSLVSLSREHPHGWGLAVFADDDAGWTVRKQPACAHEDQRFLDVAGKCGQLLVAHVRKRTVGPVGIENTHPFHRGGWVFAHNGTIEELGWLRGGTSDLRLAEIAGETDSELFFAFLLTRFDEASVDAGSGTEALSAVLADAVREFGSRPGFGACNFLLANGDGVYAYRQGRTLFALERGPHDPVRERRESAETGAIVDTPWTSRRTAVLVASERMTDEPWRAIEEHTLLHVARRPLPTLSVVAAT
jgi:glutamine amidotransferase